MTSPWRWFVFGIPVVLVALGLRVYAPSAQMRGCVGDCGNDGQVTVNELLLMVNIALGSATTSQCPVGDANANGEIAINEILAGVNNALGTCSGGTTLDIGLRAFARGDLSAAAVAFTEAAAENPRDEQARLYARLAGAGARLVDDSRGRSLAQRAGVTLTGDSHDICNLEMESPDSVPAGAPRTGEILTLLRTVLLPELQAAVETVRSLSPGTRIFLRLTDLPDCLRPSTDVDVIELDRGDLLVLESALETAMGLLDAFDGYDTDMALDLLVDGPAEALLNQEPSMLKLKSTERLSSARQHFSAAAGAGVGAIDAVRAETDDQDDDVLVIDDDAFEDHARKTRLLLTLLQDSFSRQVSLPIDVVTGHIDLQNTGSGPHERLDLSRLFSGQLKNLRGLLPAFDEDGDFDTSRFPDPRFGGITPDLTQQKIDNFLVGGPPCAVCTTDDDCGDLGADDFYCGYCYSGCTGVERRCSSGYEECPDGIFY